MGGNIFISYRREDTEGYAGRVYDRLSREFGSDRVFMDVDDIGAGEDFVDVIDEAVRTCKVLIALIGKKWVSAVGPKGQRRLDSPDDFVRLEIAAALRRNVFVVPILVHGAEMPSSDDLPEDLQPLLRRNALEIRHNRFSKDIDDLMNVISEYCQWQDAAQDGGGISSLAKRVPVWGWGGMIAAIIICAWVIMTIKNQNSSLDPIDLTELAVIGTSTTTPTASPTNTETSTPENTLTPSSTPTETFIPPTEEIGAPTLENTPTITPIPMEMLSSRGIISVTMLYIPLGEDELGDFYMDQYPVTNAQFVEFLNWFKPPSPSHWFSVEENQYLFEEDEWKVGKLDAEKPVVWVTWNGAERFCKWIGARLPLETEWEKAAGSGYDDRKYPWGNNIDCKYANYYGCSSQGLTDISDCSRNISPYNVCDLAGNVAEWVDGDDPQKGESEAILKGGSYRTDKYYLEINKNNRHKMDNPEKDIGFRCLIDRVP